jgi:shikimate 5-dehydrogenase
VSTAGSLIHEVFPRWMRVLGLGGVEVVGVDVPRDAPPERFRALLREIRDDADCLGAVVTSHKTALYRDARDEFASLDPLASACQEVNSVRNAARGRLHGYARDPVSVGRVVDAIWPDLDADLLCLGSGGTAIALARHLLGRGQRGRLTLLDRDPAQARHFASLFTDPRIEARAAQGPYDALVAAARPGTLVVNATGAGKDHEGSPVTDEVRFPRACVFWDLNYRGDLRMLAAARAQTGDRGLQAHDGRSLFCHGWAAALTAVLGLPENPELAASFAAQLD